MTRPSEKQQQVLDKIYKSSAIPEWFNRLALSVGDFYYPGSEIDRINSIFIAKSIVEKTIENVAIVHPYGDAVLHWVVLVGLLCIYEDDYSNPELSLLEELKIGDIILVDGRRVKFEGTREVSDGGEEVGFSEKKKGVSGACTTWIPENSAKRRIAPYGGLAKKLELFTGKKRLKTIGHPLFEAIYNLQKCTSYIKTSTMVVTQKRNYVKDISELIVSIKKEDADSAEMLGFCSAIPVSSYMAHDKFVRVKKKDVFVKDNRPSLLRIASNLQTAEELAKNCEAIDTIIVDGETKVAKKNWELKQLLALPSIKHRIVLLSDKTNYGIINDLKRLGFTIWSWSPDSINIFCDDKQPEKVVVATDNPFSIQRKLLSNTLNMNKKIVEIKYPDSEAGKYLAEFSDIIFYLKKYTDDPTYGRLVEELIYGTYYFRSNILSPLFGNEQITNHPNAVVEKKDEVADIKLHIELLRGTIIDKKVLDQLVRLGICIDELKSSFLTKPNPKEKAMRSYLRNIKQETAIVFKRSKNIDCAKILFEKQSSKVTFIKLSDLQENINFETLVFSGWLGSGHSNYLDNTSAAENVYFFYEIEKKIFEIETKKRFILDARSSSLADRARLLGISVQDAECLMPSLTESSISTIEDSVKNKRESALTDLISDLLLKSESALGMGLVEGVDEKCQIEAKYIIFDDDYFGYFTKNYKAKVLDRANNKVAARSIDELREGDELIFVKDSKRGLFEAMTSELHKKDPELVVKTLKWRVYLKLILGREAQSYGEIKKTLEKYHISVEEITIRHWMGDGEMIAPFCLDQLLQVLAVLANRQDILAEKDSIVKACKRLRGMHNILGRYLAKEIIGSLDVEVEQKQSRVSFKESAENLKLHIEIAQILKIGESFKIVSNKNINKLQEM